jgi:alpha-D-ribose 1-methylphosphonate 5-triphosphate synthase subunit PhnG
MWCRCLPELTVAATTGHGHVHGTPPSSAAIIDCYMQKDNTETGIGDDFVSCVFNQPSVTKPFVTSHSVCA